MEQKERKQTATIGENDDIINKKTTVAPDLVAEVSSSGGAANADDNNANINVLRTPTEDDININKNNEQVVDDENIGILTNKTLQSTIENMKNFVENDLTLASPADSDMEFHVVAAPSSIEKLVEMRKSPEAGASGAGEPAKSDSSPEVKIIEHFIHYLSMIYFITWLIILYMYVNIFLYAFLLYLKK